MNNFSHVPPGFRFHPTDEELVDYYLRKKVASNRIDLDVIKDIDLYKIEPWDLQELCRIGSEEQSEWYFFSHKDKKYPTGTRTNRATRAGFWKATGRDKSIYSKNNLIGMRKTLVFYQGRAPNGQKSDWIMHEYRLETNENGTPQEEGWAVCRVFKKRLPTVRREGEHEAVCWYDDQVSPTMPYFDSPRHHHHHHHHNHISPQPNYTSSPTSYHPHHHHHHNYSSSCKQELDSQQYHHNIPPTHDPFLQLPQLESPKLPQSSTTLIIRPDNTSSMPPYNNNNNNNNLGTILQCSNMEALISDGVHEQVTTDWRVLDKFVASQLSHDDQNIASKDTNYSDDAPSLHQEGHEDLEMLMDDSKRQEMASSSSQMDIWK